MISAVRTLLDACGWDKGDMWIIQKDGNTWKITDYNSKENFTITKVADAFGGWVKTCHCGKKGCNHIERLGNSLQ